MDGAIAAEMPAAQHPPGLSSDWRSTGITARLANTVELLHVAGRIRYDAYLSQGFIDPSEERIFLDECDWYSTSKVVIVYKDHVPVGTARVCLYDPCSEAPEAQSIPVMEVFGTEILRMLAAVPLRARSPRAVEVMRLATVPDIGSDTEIVFALYLMAGYLILHFQANAVVCAVRRHHIAFYRRLGLLKAAEPRAYPKLKFRTGLVASVQHNTEELQRSMPILHPISVNDDIYPAFMAGSSVPVFEGLRSPETVIRLLSQRRDGLEVNAGMWRQSGSGEIAAPAAELAA